LKIPNAVRWVARRVRHPLRSLKQAVYRLPEGRLRRRFLGFPSEGALLRELRGVLGDDEVWVFPAPSCPWGYLFQRPQQFARAAMAAAKLLEPQIQPVHLTSGTLKTEQDVKTWLADVERDLLDKLKNGPVVIS